LSSHQQQSTEEPLVFFLKLLLVYVGLAALAWILAQFVHGYLYTGAPRSINWRAPVAAAVVWLLGLALPMMTKGDYSGSGWPVSFNDLFLFSTGKPEVEFPEFTVPSADGKKSTNYKRTQVARGVGGAGIEYRDENGQPMPAAPMVLLTKEGDKKVRFEIAKKTDKDGKEYIDRGDDGRKMLRWTDEEGRVMTEDNFGRISSSAVGGVFFFFFATLVSWTVWFLCIWLLLLFQWPHALGFSIPLWLAWLFILNFLKPMLG
jgi:hypothetical protein